MTISGTELSKKLYEASNKLIDENNNISLNERLMDDDIIPENQYILERGSFDIILLIDQIELNNNPKILSMIGNEIKYEIRKLNIGDYLWIAKSNKSSFFYRFLFIIRN